MQQMCTIILHFVVSNLKPNFSAAKLNIFWTAADLADGTGTA